MIFRAHPTGVRTCLHEFGLPGGAQVPVVRGGRARQGWVVPFAAAVACLVHKVDVVTADGCISRHTACRRAAGEDRGAIAWGVAESLVQRQT